MKMIPTSRETKRIRVELLDFDPQNPRFYDGQDMGEANVIRRMLEQENLEELVDSIGNQGFFPGEPLLVTSEGAQNDHHIVVEGNRRLAALKVLNGLVSELPPSLQTRVDQAAHKPLEIECFVFDRRKDILKYLGFRHISGPRRWEPLAKARYLKELQDTFYSSQSLTEQLRALARDIGSRSDYVAQLLTTLALYDRAKNTNEFYGLQRLRESDINFSLLSTALSYTKIAAYLNLPSRTAVDVSGVNDDHAKDLFNWLFAQKDDGETTVGESRQLKQLAAVLGSEQATQELKSTQNLSKAYLFSEGPAQAAWRLLSDVEATLKRCLSMTHDELSVDDSHIEKAEKISDLAEDLWRQLERQKRRMKQRQNAHLEEA